MPHDFNKFPELTDSQMQFYYFESPHRQITEGFVAMVDKVTDGDTIRVDWKERDFTFPVRFANINAPEMNNGGLESKKWLADKIEGEEVYVQINPYNRVGKFGRIIGEVFHMGININEQLINQGRAVPFGQEMPW